MDFATLTYERKDGIGRITFSRPEVHNAFNGQMIEEFDAKAKATDAFREIAMAMTHRREVGATKKKSSLAPILEKLKLKL